MRKYFGILVSYVSANCIRFTGISQLRYLSERSTPTNVHYYKMLLRVCKCFVMFHLIVFSDFPFLSVETAYVLADCDLSKNDKFTGIMCELCPISSRTRLFLNLNLQFILK